MFWKFMINEHAVLKETIITVDNCKTISLYFLEELERGYTNQGTVCDLSAD